MLHLRRVLIICVLSATFSGCRLIFTRSGSETLSQAEEALRQDKFDRAIELYQSHMNNRLKIKNRKEWENPFFYTLMIGDIYLKANQPEKALLSYQTAQ